MPDQFKGWELQALLFTCRVNKNESGRHAALVSQLPLGKNIMPTPNAPLQSNFSQT